MVCCSRGNFDIPWTVDDDVSVLLPQSPILASLNDLFMRFTGRKSAVIEEVDMFSGYWSGSQTKSTPLFTCGVRFTEVLKCFCI